jgi:hypothetical protein
MDYSKRIDEAYHQISAIKNKQAQRDLLLFLRGAEAAYSKLDAESVNCRRLKKETVKYLELKQNLEEVLSYLEKHITFASLLN